MDLNCTLFYSLVPLAAGPLAVNILGAGAEPPPRPERGVASSRPATKWEGALVSGSGKMGAMVWGQPVDETIILDHERLYAPLGSREILPDIARYLPQVREMIKQGKCEEAHLFWLEKAKEHGFPGSVWTDPFHPGLELKIRTHTSGEVKDYLRTENFQTGEANVYWTDDQGQHRRRLFVSRPDNVAVLSVTGSGKVSCDLWIADVGEGMKFFRSSEVKVEDGFLTIHNAYKHPKKGYEGYDGVAKVISKGGKLVTQGGKVSVSGADEVLVLMRIQPLPDAGRSAIASVQADLSKLKADYEGLLKPHVKVHGKMFNRASLDLGGGTDRNLTSEELLDRATKEGKVSPALLELMYDVGRYVAISSSGELPPNLQGVWGGTWDPAWSGDFTLDTNLQLAIASELSANMPELLGAYFNLVESFIPDWRENARKYYGCRGIAAGTRVSNNGLLLHWHERFPGAAWTAGAGWLAHWYYDYYLYTGDRDFLAKRAVPYMKEVALFYEDFLMEDENGRYVFSPSYSPENGGLCYNATMDVAVAKELLTNLVAACEELKTEPEGVEKWRRMLTKMPEYRINSDGALAEWIPVRFADNYDHRHFSHMYPIFTSYEFTPEETPRLWKAAGVALEMRMKYWHADTSSHGRMHAGLCAARLGEGNLAYHLLSLMASDRSMYTSMVTSHYAGESVFNVDANGAIPEVVNNCLVFSLPGKLDLLPALPDALPKGSISGILARGQIRIDRLEWDKPAGTVKLTLTSGKDQTVMLRSPTSTEMTVTVTKGTAALGKPGPQANGREVSLPRGETVSLVIGLR